MHDRIDLSQICMSFANAACAATHRGYVGTPRNIGRAEGQYGKEEKATAYVAPEEELRLNCVRSIRRLLLSIVPIGFFPWQSQQKKP